MKKFLLLLVLIALSPLVKSETEVINFTIPITKIKNGQSFINTSNTKRTSTANIFIETYVNYFEIEKQTGRKISDYDILTIYLPGSIYGMCSIDRSRVGANKVLEIKHFKRDKKDWKVGERYENLKNCAHRMLSLNSYDGALRLSIRVTYSDEKKSTEEVSSSATVKAPKISGSIPN